MKSRHTTLRERAMQMVQQFQPHGLTPDQVAIFLSESVLAVRPRLTELLNAGRVKRSGERRLNRTGKSAHVLVEA